ncbi:MAG: GtrA family protein [Parachlamydiaceae bacterium]|nr:GtrA family protein [Parachlamydiaceae bacterium]
MVILTIALWQEVNLKLSIILGITASTTLLFLLDRHFVFSYARHKRVTPQIFGFILACFIGGALNYFSTIGLLSTFSGLLPQIAEIGGLIIGAIFNYFFLRYLVFRKDA